MAGGGVKNPLSVMIAVREAPDPEFTPGRRSSYDFPSEKTCQSFFMSAVWQEGLIHLQNNHS